MGRTKRQRVETTGTTTHKNKIRHTQKQKQTNYHTNKKTSLKITNKTKQIGKTTHKKTKKNYFLLLTYRKMAKTPQLTPKEKKELQDRFSKMDANPHTDYRIIAFELAKDYRRLTKKCRGLEEEIDRLSALI